MGVTCVSCRHCYGEGYFSLCTNWLPDATTLRHESHTVAWRRCHASSVAFQTFVYKELCTGEPAGRVAPAVSAPEVPRCAALRPRRASSPPSAERPEGLPGAREYDHELLGHQTSCSAAAASTGDAREIPRARAQVRRSA